MGFRLLQRKGLPDALVFGVWVILGNLVPFSCNTLHRSGNWLVATRVAGNLGGPWALPSDLREDMLDGMSRLRRVAWPNRFFLCFMLSDPKSCAAGSS